MQKDDVPYVHELTDLNIINDHIEALVLKISKPKVRIRTVVNFYRPHTYTNNAIFYESQIVKDPRVKNTEIWLMGDSNIDAQFLENAICNNMNNFLLENNLKLVAHKNTRITPESSTQIDHI